MNHLYWLGVWIERLGRWLALQVATRQSVDWQP
jgi:hypothetical protein